MRWSAVGVLVLTIALSHALVGCSRATTGRVLVPSTTEPTPASASSTLVPGRIVVRYRPRQAASTRRLIGGKAISNQLALGPDFQVLTLGAADEATTRAALEELAADPDVAFARADQLRELLTLPNQPSDPLLSQQWGLSAVRAADAWRLARADGVTVAVLDSGYGPHPDLPQPGDPHHQPGYDFVSCRGPADATACPNAPGCANTRDCDGPDPDPTDPGGGENHGQHVAGIIGALTDNGVGVAGLAWGVKIQSVRVTALADDGVERGSDSDIAAAIEWLAGNPVHGIAPPHRPDVINMSLGGRGLTASGTCDDGAVLQAAISDATAAGIVVVAAAGNVLSGGVDVSNGDTALPCPTVPAALDHVIAVGALALAGDNGPLTRAYYSNYGAKVTVMAPGGGDSVGECTSAAGAVLSTVGAAAGCDYGYLVGTSQAAPFVAGAVALIRAVNPYLGTSDIIQILKSSADSSLQCDKPNGCGAGVLDVGRAVDQAIGGRQVRGAEVVGGCSVGDHSTPCRVVAVVLFGVWTRRRRQRPRR